MNDAVCVCVCVCVCVGKSQRRTKQITNIHLVPPATMCPGINVCRDCLTPRRVTLAAAEGKQHWVDQKACHATPTPSTPPRHVPLPPASHPNPKPLPSHEPTSLRQKGFPLALAELRGNGELPMARVCACPARQPIKITYGRSNIHRFSARTKRLWGGLPEL